jgi:hypothetical protein
MTEFQKIQLRADHRSCTGGAASSRRCRWLHCRRVKSMTVYASQFNCDKADWAGTVSMPRWDRIACTG